MKTDVIIIGAGPTGLSLACHLLRYGISFVIIEKNESITHLSKALGVHARTLEIYEQLGLAEQAVKEGAIAEKLRLIAAGKVRDGINLSETGKNLSPYPFFKFGIVQKSAFSLLSQIGINYPDSVLSNHSGDNKFKVKAGDRMPYFLVDGKSIYDKLRQPLFHLITFSDGRNQEQYLTEKIEHEYNHLVDCQNVPLYPHIAEIFGTNESFSILLRPDNYIGFVSRKLSLDELENYFNKVVNYTLN